MKDLDKELAKKLIDEIANSKMTFQRKMVVFRLLDKAFRNTMGAFYLSNEELDENDILFRSM